MEKQKENERKKEYLLGYKRASRQLARLQEELYELRMNKIAPSVMMGGMPYASGENDMSGYAAKVDELERKIMKARYKRLRKFKEIRDRIEKLENENEKDILVYRYIRNQKWEEISVKMGYEWAQIHRFHARALNHFSIR